MKRWIIFVHRYVGIPMSLVFVVWFLSGIVMMYTGGMPALGEQERLEGLGPIDFSRIALSPAEAASRAGADAPVVGVRLRNLLGRPAYRLRPQFGRPVSVFADTGEVFREASGGIPEYRLPKDVLDLEIAQILALGPKLKTNAVLGKDFTIASLRQQGYGAIFLGIGAWRSSLMRASPYQAEGKF